jgi:cardiolipin synthase
MLTELLLWNVEVFYQPAPFCHSKLLCVDDHYSLVGSANLDPRSLRLNYELGIEIFSHTLNKELSQHFDNIIVRSEAISDKDLANRSVPVRLRDSFMSLLSPYL